MSLTPVPTDLPNIRTTKLFIFGSCVSRDIFSFPGSDSIELVDFYSRSSFASMASQPPKIDVNYNNLTSSFQQRMVRRDIGKDLFSNIRNTHFDVLLIDLIDERYNIYQFSDNTICTVSKEFKNTRFKFPRGSGRTVYSGSQRHLQLWKWGWNKFMRAVKAVDMVNKIRINKVYWATETECGQCIPLYSQEIIERNNELLNVLYEKIEQELGKEVFIEFDQSLMKAANEHKWGAAPFHYSDEFYLNLIDKLKSVSI